MYIQRVYQIKNIVKRIILHTTAIQAQFRGKTFLDSLPFAGQGGKYRGGGLKIWGLSL